MKIQFKSVDAMREFVGGGAYDGHNAKFVREFGMNPVEVVTSKDNEWWDVYKGGLIQWTIWIPEERQYFELVEA